MSNQTDQSNPIDRLIEWGVSARTHPGEIESGDRCLVHEFPGGALVVVVDGLGHGVEAAAAALRAIATAKSFAGESVAMIVQRCHTALIGSRGVVMSLATFDGAGKMTWTGVGNVEAHLLRVEPQGTVRLDSVTLRGGVVGYQLPPLASTDHTVRTGDTLVFATDGIAEDFVRHVALHESPQDIADRIMSRGATGKDDALALVARYVAGSA